MTITRSHPPPQGRGRGERAASLVEYALLLALIAAVCIGALTYFGGQSGNSVNNSADRIVTAG
jgi:Flp pilus assembly pilin Flp